MPEKTDISFEGVMDENATKIFSQQSHASTFWLFILQSTLDDPIYSIHPPTLEKDPFPHLSFEIGTDHQDADGFCAPSHSFRKVLMWSWSSRPNNSDIRRVDNEKSDEPEISLPYVEKGEKHTVQSAQLLEKQTNPKPLHTGSKLVVSDGKCRKRA